MVDLENLLSPVRRPRAAPADILDAANELAEVGDFVSARLLLQDALQLFPDNSDLLTRLASAIAQDGSLTLEARERLAEPH